MLSFMTGWNGEKHKIFNTTKRKLCATLPHPCQFDANSEQMMIYTDLISFSTMGSENMPLLRTIHLDSDGYPCHRQFNEIQYHRLRVQEIDHIDIHLMNTFGKPMDFREGTHSIVVLHFRHHLPLVKAAEEGKSSAE